MYIDTHTRAHRDTHSYILYINGVLINGNVNIEMWSIFVSMRAKAKKRERGRVKPCGFNTTQVDCKSFREKRVEVSQVDVYVCVCVCHSSFSRSFVCSLTRLLQHILHSLQFLFNKKKWRQRAKLTTTTTTKNFQENERKKEKNIVFTLVSSIYGNKSAKEALLNMHASVPPFIFSHGTGERTNKPVSEWMYVRALTLTYT